MKVKPIEEIVSFLEPIAKEVGVEIVDAEWNFKQRSLTIFIDKEGGLDLITCEAFHHAIDEPLDEFDPTFGEAYTLNCSSPGLDRPFKTEKDYLRHIGEKVECKLYAPHQGKKLFEGTLTAFDGTAATIATDKGEVKLPLNQIAKICLLIEV